jgi:hypothetical protein
MRKIFISLFLLVSVSDSYAASLVGRLGVGMSDQLVTGMKTISLKLQQNRSTAIGGIFGIDNSEDGSFYAVGLRYYRFIYEEPQLNFYSAFSGSMFTYNNTTDDKTESGYQVDGLFGSEFNFQGLESVGFSFEFGGSLYNYDSKTHIATAGYNFIKSAIHFYL